MVESLSPFEDQRGVDVTQIRHLLGMTDAERVAEMIEFSNTVLDIQAHVRRASTSSPG